MTVDPLLVDLALPFSKLRPEAWGRLRAAGAPWRGVILRAGHGLRDDGPRLREHAAAIREAGLELAFYWYLLARSDGTMQANAFADLMREQRPTLLPIVDVEGAGNERATAARVMATTRAFVGRVRERTGQATILYAGAWARAMLGPRARDLGCDLLWLPAYVARLSPTYFTGLGFRFADLLWWQYCGADGRGVHAALAGYPRTTPAGPMDISVQIMPGGIERARWAGGCGDPSSNRSRERRHEDR